MSIDILLTTCNRLPALTAALSGIAGQTVSNVRLIVADSGDQPARKDAVVQSLLRIIEARGATVSWFHRPPGDPAVERNFLLEQATAQYVLFMDDSVWMEPQAVQRMAETIETQQCGFVGARPDALVQPADPTTGERWLEVWEGSVQPETIAPRQREWRRERMHQDAAFSALSLRMLAGEHILYKVAYTSGCVMYDRARLVELGGFPTAGEMEAYPSVDAAAQNMVMRQYGGCSLLPSGVYQIHGSTEHAIDHLLETLTTQAPQGVG